MDTEDVATFNKNAEMIPLFHLKDAHNLRTTATSSTRPPLKYGLLYTTVANFIMCVKKATQTFGRDYGAKLYCSGHLGEIWCTDL